MKTSLKGQETSKFGHGALLYCWLSWMNDEALSFPSKYKIKKLLQKKQYSLGIICSQKRLQETFGRS